MGHDGVGTIKVASSRRVNNCHTSLERLLTNSRFPIVAGLRVVWDHRNPPNQRVKSIHLTNPEDDDDDSDDGETAEDMIDFVEQEDGTRVEVKQKRIELGDEVKNEAGGRIYRVVSWGIPFCRGGRLTCRSPEITWHKATMVSKLSRTASLSLTMRRGKSCHPLSDLSSLVSFPISLSLPYLGS